MEPEPKKIRRQLGGELIIPTLSIVFVLYFFATVWNSPWTAQVSAFLVGGVLLLVCAIFIARTVIWLSRGEGTLGFGNVVSWEDVGTGRLGLFLATLGFCLLIEPLGFTLTAFLFLLTAMLILAKGRRPLFILGLSAAIALVGWAVFIWAFETRFPRGYFEEFMRMALANG